MNHIAGLLVIGILMLLASVHVYWAVGGRRGQEVAIPIVAGKPLFQPGPVLTLLVALLLMGAALLIAGQLYGQQTALAWVFEWGTWGIVGVFSLRAMGDFHVLGFTKKVRGTKFSVWDDRLFSPLCITIALLAFIVVFY